MNTSLATLASAEESRLFAEPRITLRIVLASLADGDSVDAIVAAFPGLTTDDVRAAIAFAEEAAD